MCDTILSHDAGLWRQQPPVNHAIMKAHNEYTSNCCTPNNRCFTLSVMYSINYKNYSTVYYKASFMPDDCAQVETNTGVLSMFEVH